METQEPLFNNTIFRYDLQHDIFEELQSQGKKVDDNTAVRIVATLGTKGPDYFSCNQDMTRGDNVMSIAYAPGNRGSASKNGMFYVAWEQSRGSKDLWRPAACMNYIQINFDHFLPQQ